MPTGNVDPIIVQLTERRKEQGISAQALSTRCDWPKNQISMYESGRRTPDLIRLRKWAGELGLSPVLAGGRS